MPISSTRQLRPLYQAHAAWLEKQLSGGFQVQITPGVSVHFRGFRRPVELQTALADIFDSYMRLAERTFPDGADAVLTVSVCRAALLECAHAVVKARLVRALAARSVFEWPLPAGAA
jgi:hypothetical protein